MKHKTEKIFSAILILMLALNVAAIIMPKARASPAAVRVIPDPVWLGDATGTKVIGDYFTIAVVAEDITGAYGADVKLYWNTTYFDYVSHNFTMPWNTTTLADTGPSPYGGFLYSPGMKVKDSVDTTAGQFWGAYSSMSPAYVFNGNGTLVSIKLEVIDQVPSFELPLGHYLNMTFDVDAKIVDKNGIDITPPETDGTVHLYSWLWSYPPVPMLKVMPVNIEGSGLGDSHVVSVWLMGADGNDLDPFWDPGGFELQLNFNTTLLQGSGVTIDPDGWFNTFWPNVLEIKKTVNNTEGTVFVAFAGYGSPHTPVSGKGRLFTVNFTEIFESTSYPPPECTLSLQVPTEYDDWPHLHADSGMIPLSTPTANPGYHAVDAAHYMISYHLDSWTDQDGDGELSVGDELQITDGSTSKWRDYTVDVLTGTLNVTQTELNITDTMHACPGYMAPTSTPGNVTLSMPNLGTWSAEVSFANGTTRPLAPAEYTEYYDSTDFGLDVVLDSNVTETYVEATNITTPGYAGVEHWVGPHPGIWKVHVKFPNSTERDLSVGEYYGPIYLGWGCDFWWYVAVDLPVGTVMTVDYSAVSMVTIDYRTVESDAGPRFLEFKGTYAEFEASRSSPVNSNYSEIYPQSWRSPYQVVNWLDDDTSGDLTAGDRLVLEYIWTGSVGKYVVDGLATDMVVARQRCICDRDVTDEFYCDSIKAKIAGVAYPDREMCPWHNQEYSVLLPHEVQDGTFEAAMAVLTGIDVYTQYPDPFGGQGYMKNSDMFWTQKEVCLFGFAFYNEWPEQNKDVAFKVIDPHGETYAVLYGRTNEVGIATVCFRLPWMCEDPEYYIGEWTVIAEVDIACVCYNDTLHFKYDYLVNTWKVTSDKDEYAHCEDIAITIEYGSYAMQRYNITYTITILDDSGVPFGYKEVTFEIGGAQYCTYMNDSFTVFLHVVKWARAGFATIHVGALDWRGNPINPLATHTVYILPEWAI
jgi:hypothetical protein